MGVSWDSSEAERLAFIWRGVYHIREINRLWFAIPAYPGSPLYAATVKELAERIKAAEEERTTGRPECQTPPLL